MSTPEPQGYYPQQAYYAPGWQAPVPPSPEDQRRRRRRRRTIVWTVAGVALAAAGVAAVVGVRFMLDTRSVGTVEAATVVHARQLERGHCLAELPDDGSVDRVTVVPCADPHAAEVVGVHRFADGPWPGQAEVTGEAAASCEMDTAQRTAGAQAVVWAPSERGWGQGDRSALCLAHHPDGEVQGSWSDGDGVLP